MNLGTPSAASNYNLPSAMTGGVGFVNQRAAPADWWGQAPWYSVPWNNPFQRDGWPVCTDGRSNIYATDPLTGRVYACRTNEAYTLVFQKLPTC